VVGAVVGRLERKRGEELEAIRKGEERRVYKVMQ
jgi:hypothetical protein